MVHNLRTEIRPVLVLCALFLLVSACASAPPKQVSGYTPAITEQAVQTAVSMIGKPYKYQGDSPAGFDCSGLVKYSYQVAGLELPHGTRNLLQVTKPVGAQMQKGDLLFFNEKGGEYSHVGIYLESYVFVHAPGAGGKVRKDSLQDSYWKKRFLEARRFN